MKKQLLCPTCGKELVVEEFDDNINSLILIKYYAVCRFCGFESIAYSTKDMLNAEFGVYDEETNGR